MFSTNSRNDNTSTSARQFLSIPQRNKPDNRDACKSSVSFRSAQEAEMSLLCNVGNNFYFKRHNRTFPTKNRVVPCRLNFEGMASGVARFVRSCSQCVGQNPTTSTRTLCSCMQGSSRHGTQNLPVLCCGFISVLVRSEYFLSQHVEHSHAEARNQGASI